MSGVSHTGRGSCTGWQAVPDDCGPWAVEGRMERCAAPSVGTMPAEIIVLSNTWLVSGELHPKADILRDRTVKGIVPHGRLIRSRVRARTDESYFAGAGVGGGDRSRAWGVSMLCPDLWVNYLYFVNFEVEQLVPGEAKELPTADGLLKWIWHGEVVFHVP